MNNQNYKLSELTTLIARGITPKYTDSKDSISVVNQKCIRDGKINFGLCRNHHHHSKKISSEKILQINDILINSTGVGTLGRVSQIIDDLSKTTCDSHVTIVRPDPTKISPSFLGAFTYLNQKIIESLGHGSTGQTELSRFDLGEIEIPKLSDKKQKFIGDFFQCLNRKIELNQKNNKTLEEIANAIFKSWFIDFDPVKVKSEGGSNELPDEISDLFPDSFEDSELGKIPRNWKFFELDKISEFQNGYAFKSKEYIEKSESSLEIFRMGYIHRGGGFKEDNSPVFVDNSSTGYQKKYSLEKNDLTISMTDMKNKMAILGCCALVEESNRFLLNQRVGRIRVKNCEILSSEYLYLHMNYPTHVDQIRSKSNSGVQVNLSTDVIKSTPILIPDKLVMEKFSKISNDLFSKIFKNNEMTKTIVEMRNILFPKLISGEVKILDAEKIIEEFGI